MSFYNFARAVCNIVLSLGYSIKIEGIDNIPDKGHGYLLVCNHQSYLDPPLLGCRLRKHQITFMANEKLFRKPVLGPIIRKVGAFPVGRGKNSANAIDTAIQKLNQGDLVALFPEGTRSKTGELLPGKSGAVIIAAKTGADVIPAAITYKNNSRRFRTKITVRYGEIIPNEKLGVTEDAAPSQIKAARKIIMEKIAELFYQ